MLMLETLEYGLETLTDNEMDNIVIASLDKSQSKFELAEIN